MQFSDIRPFVRYARYMTVSPKEKFKRKIPYDARLFYTVSGEGSIIVGDVEYKTTPADLLLFPSGTPYTIGTTDSEVCYAVLNFDYTMPSQDLKMPIPPATEARFSEKKLIPTPPFEDIPPISTVFVSGAYKFESNIDLIIKEYSRRMLYFEAKISSLLSGLLFDIIRRNSSRDFGRADSKLDEMLRYIDLNFAKELSNAHIAEVFSFHPNYVGEIIKKGTGLSLHKYLMHVRLLRALDMLDSGETNISAVAESCGFFDSAHFSRAFKKAFGDSPKKYTNKQK